MADCKRMAVAAGSAGADDSPSKKRRIRTAAATPAETTTTTTMTMLHTHHQELHGESKGVKQPLVRRSSSDVDVEQSPPSSCCSGNEVHDVVSVTSPLLDLERLQAKSFGDDSTAPVSHKFSRETTPSSELSLAEVSKAPPISEMEEFFETAEKYEQKRFAEKYNFDVVKEAPLDGRYHWVRLKP